MRLINPPAGTTRAHMQTQGLRTLADAAVRVGPNREAVGNGSDPIDLTSPVAECSHVRVSHDAVDGCIVTRSVDEFRSLLTD